MSSAVKVDPILPALEIACMVAMVLFGISTVQVYTYFSKYPDDLRRMKLFVIVIWLLEFVHSILTGYAVYITSFGHVLYPEAAVDEVFHSTIAYSALVSMLIQSFGQVWFSYRLYKVSRSAYLPILCTAIAMAQFILFYVAVLYKLSTGESRRVWNKMQMASAILAVSNDPMIAIGLCWCMWKRRKNRVIGKTVVDKILWWFLQTNLLLGIFAIVTIILYRACPLKSANYVAVCLGIICCRLYSISFFASLIERRRWLDQTYIQANLSLSADTGIGSERETTDGRR